MKSIVCFGEVLWDIFPNEEKIGGAPLNVALRLTTLGNSVNIISRYGADQYGDRLLNYLQKNGLSTDLLQQDRQYDTGKVIVTTDAKGSASYDIHYPAAWDKIAYVQALEHVVKQSAAFIYGSLACRDVVSKSTLLKLLSVAQYKILDVNLRPPYYDMEMLQALMLEADFIKLNDDELYEITKALGSTYNSLEQNITFLAHHTNTHRICVTKGSHGAVLFYDKRLYYNSGYRISVVDTVGSGDSFLAALIHSLLISSSPQEAINFACAVGALVASYQGANPPLSLEMINAFAQLDES